MEATIRRLIPHLFAALCLAAAPLQALAQQPAEGDPSQGPQPPLGTMPAPSTGDGQTTGEPTGAPTVAGVQDANFPLGLGDVVYVGVIGRQDYSVRARVGADGSVVLPLIGSIPAVGKTTEQLAEDVRAQLEKGGYFSNPVVRVEILGVASRYVTVLGFVGSPGLVPLDRNYRLSEMLARVGGRGGGGADTVILTHSDGKSETYRIEDLATSVANDPTLQAGDRIFIPAVENQVVYVSGQVKSPGAFPVSADMTFRIAIAKAGGVTDMGSEKKLKVVRNGEKVKVKLDDPVKPGDIVEIGERLF